MTPFCSRLRKIVNTYNVMKRGFLKKLHVRNEEGTIEVAKAGNAQKREIAFEHQSNMESAKHTMMLYQREYEDALTKSRSNDKFHEKRVKFYTQKLKAQKKKVHALRAQALSIESRGNATRAKILMEMNATVTDLSDKMATAADEIQTTGEVREAKKERKEKQQMEMDRMHERQREREEVANKAAMKSVSDKQANAESAAAKMAAAAAYEKLQKVAQEAGSLPDAEG